MDYQKITVTLIGNATQAAEVKQGKESGKAYGDFRVAVHNRQGESTYFPVHCFGKLAEGVTQIKKGTKLFVAGELDITSFQGTDGHTQTMFRVLADTYRILGESRRSQKAPAPAAEAATPPQA